MKRSTLLALVGAQTVLMVAFGWTAAYLGRDEFRLASAPEPVDAASRTATPDAPGLPPIVRIAEAALPIVGIDSVQGDAGTPTEGTAAADLIATVLDTQPLVDLQARWRAAAAEAQAAQAAAAASARERARVQALFDDDRNASQRALDAAAAQSLSDAARARGAAAALDALRAGARTAWGAPLQAALMTEERTQERPDRHADAHLAALLAGREVLLRVALRPDDVAPAPPSVVLRPPAGGTAVARLVSTVAPGALPSDAAFAGRASLYRAPGAGLSPGMRLAVAPAGAARGPAAAAGVSVPASAIVWYAGQPWVYQRLTVSAAAASGAAPDADDVVASVGKAAGDDRDDDAKDDARAARPARDPASASKTASLSGATASSAPAPARESAPVARFQRRAVADAERRATRWFLPGVDAQAVIVAHGAQVLLSEELRALSHDDDD